MWASSSWLWKTKEDKYVCVCVHTYMYTWIYVNKCAIWMNELSVWYIAFGGCAIPYLHLLPSEKPSPGLLSTTVTSPGNFLKCINDFKVYKFSNLNFTSLWGDSENLGIADSDCDEVSTTLNNDSPLIVFSFVFV